jgi:hypothetical protein
VAVSTFLTLLVVPALYSVLDGLFGRKGAGVRHEREAAAVLAELDAAEAQARLAAARAGVPAREDAP